MPRKNSKAKRTSERSLDPEDWEKYRKIAHHALDDALDYIKDVRKRPLWRPVPEKVKNALNEPIPQKGKGLEKTYRDFRQLILPYATGNIHPRFWGWVHGSGLATGIVSEMMSAAMNSNCGGRDHGAIYVERQVVNWFRRLLGYPVSARGILLSGTSMGNAVGLAIARNSHIGSSARKDGVRASSKKLVAYASVEVHSSVAKALELIGLGNSSLRKIPVDTQFSIDPNSLRHAIQQDRREGLEPFCVIGCSGTVNTGALDDLTALSEICRTEKLWFHVDGAFGAMCALSKTLRKLIRGIETADSIAFDAHKWLHIQYDAGCLLVRNGNVLRAAFASRPDYLQHTDRGLGGGGEWPTDLGPELSRSFRALKIWFALKEHGTKRFAEMIEKNCIQARYLANSLEKNPLFELLQKPTLNIVCFRYKPSSLGEKSLDRLNNNIVASLQENGIAAPSTTRVNGKLYIRVAITNHRSEFADFDELLCSVQKIASQLKSICT